MSLTKRTILFAAASAAALTAGHAAAQNEGRTVDVITVTAQKREEGIQDVPVAVTAYSEELLSNAGVRDLKDLAVIAPGLNVTSTSNEFQTTARIRGIGTVGDNPGLESSVGVVINGVPRARNGVGFGDLGEIERIEVLRGPQGTLFGANTSAGIINVVTKRPEYEFGAHAEATVSGGGADGWGVAGGMTGGLSDNVAARIYGASRQRDGFQSVQTFGGPRTTTEDANQDFYTLNGQVLFDISDNVNLLLGADYTSRDEDCCLGTALVSGPTAPIINALVPALWDPPISIVRRLPAILRASAMMPAFCRSANGAVVDAIIKTSMSSATRISRTASTAIVTGSSSQLHMVRSPRACPFSDESNQVLASAITERWSLRRGK